MSRIEFVGSNGIGKSTLFHRACENRNRADTWLTPDEALKKIVVDSCRSIFPLNRRGLIKYNLFPRYHENWIRGVLSIYNRNVHLSSLNDYNDWLNLFIEGISLYKHSEAFFKLKNFKIYCQRLEDLAYCDYFKLKNIVLWDEGLFRNNPGIEELPSFSEFMTDNPDRKSNPLGIVYCYLETNENIRRIKSRVKENFGKTVIKGDIIIEKGGRDEMRANDDDLLKMCIHTQKRYKQIAEAVKSAGIPVLEIDMMNDIDNNAAKVSQFIREIEKSADTQKFNNN